MTDRRERSHAHGTVVDDLASPHIGDLRHCSPALLREFANQVEGSIRELLMKYANTEFASVKREFAADIKMHGLLLDDVRARLFGQRLADLNAQGHATRTQRE